MLQKKRSIFVFALVLLLAIPAGVAAADITLGYVEWDCAISQTHIAAAVLEEYFDLEVELMSVDVGILWAGLSQGDLDAFLAAWLPVTHGFYWEEYGKDLINVGANFEGGKIGLVVPQYVDIDSITELNDNSRKFRNMIYGIDPGAGLMAATDAALDIYGLNFNVMDSSDAAMVIQLGQAIRNDEWIVVTGWVPHWKFDVWDLKFLEDPHNVYGGSENIQTVLRKGFFADFDPAVSSFMARYKLTQAQLHEMMNIVREGSGSELELARQWVLDNEDVVQGWID